MNGIHSIRSSWKTLRDFVNERDIEKALDRIENDRDALDVRPFGWGAELFTDIVLNTR